MTEPTPPVVLRFHPDAHEPEMVEFYTALGMCIASWAFIDRKLYEICHFAMQLAQKQSALLFYRQRAFHQRLHLVDDAIKAFLPREEFDKHWSALHERIVDLSHTRNVFAHHPTRRVAASVDGKPRYTYLIYIEPFERILNREYKGLRGKNDLRVADLREHDQELTALELDLRWFLEVVVLPKCVPENLRRD